MMKKFLLIITLLFSMGIHAQHGGTIDSIITKHLKEFRQFTGPDAKILIDFTYGFPNENIKMDKNDLVILTYINPKKVKKGEYFLVKFIIEERNGSIVLKAVNYRVKVVKKTINLINLLNGNTYPVK